MLEFPSVEAAGRVGEFEWPQEVAGLLEIWSDGIDLMDQVLDTDNTVFAEVIFNKLVVCERDTLLVDFAISALVNKLTNRFEIGIAVSDVWVDNGQHFSCSLGQTNEDTIVDLEETKKLENLARLWRNLVDTGRWSVNS